MKKLSKDLIAPLPISKLGVAAAFLYLIPVSTLYVLSLFAEDKYQFAEMMYIFFAFILTAPWSFGGIALVNFLEIMPDGLWWDRVIATFFIFFGAILNAIIFYFAGMLFSRLAKKALSLR